MFCGWDWGSTAHGVCLIDDRGDVVKRWMVEHTESHLTQVFGELAELVEGRDVGQVPIAIERGEGLIVGLIAGAGHPVWMVEPAAFKAARPRWGSAGAKSDLGDAFMLADYARTDGHRLRRVEPVARATRELAALVRARTALVQARTAASNQLWAVLAEHWPGAAVVFQKLTSPIALAFLTDYPTPQSAALLGEGRMSLFCRRHSYRGGQSPAELVRRLRAAPACANPIAPTILEAIVGASTAHIRLLNTEISRLERDLSTTLAAHPKTAAPADTAPRRHGQPGRPDRRDRAPARPLREPRTGGRDVRCCPGDSSLGQVPHRRIPLQRQQASTGRDHELRRQLATLRPLGQRRLPACPRARRPTPPRRQNPRPQLGASPLGLLDQRHHLRPLTPPRPATPRRRDLT